MFELETKTFTFNVNEKFLKITSSKGYVKEAFPLERICYAKIRSYEENVNAALGLMVILGGVLCVGAGYSVNNSGLIAAGVLGIVGGIILAVQVKRDSELTVQVHDTVYKYEADASLDDMNKLLDELL